MDIAQVNNTSGLKRRPTSRCSRRPEPGSRQNGYESRERPDVLKGEAGAAEPEFRHLQVVVDVNQAPVIA